MPMQIDTLTELPDVIRTLEPSAIRSVFPNPTLITLRGRQDPPLFLSTLLHGNETTSFRVLQNLATYLRSHPLPRSLLIFIGNVRACEAGVRHLPDEEDFNRIWSGGQGPQFEMAKRVFEIAKAENPFASIDIHNNTGLNPVYGCINDLGPEHLNLLSLFSHIGVFYRIPPTTQSFAFSKLCPAVTLECGKPDTPEGIERATQFVIDILHRSDLPKTFPLEGPLELYHTVARVRIAAERSFAFGRGEADVVFPAEIERWNFSPKPAGTALAQSRFAGWPLHVTDDAGRDVTERYFLRDGETIRLARPAIPSMITLDPDIIRSDCFGYLMEPIAYGPPEARPNC